MCVIPEVRRLQGMVVPECWTCTLRGGGKDGGALNRKRNGAPLVMKGTFFKIYLYLES